MKKLSIISLAAAAIVGCSGADNEMDLALDNEVKITSSISTRASGEAWAEGDKIGVYMSKTDGTFAELGANTLYTTAAGDGAFATTTPLYYPMNGTADMLAYYPYNDAAEFDATRYAVDVTDQSSLPKIDLMVASKEGVAKSSSAVNMTFAHKLTNIIIAVKAGEGFETSDLTGLKITLAGTQAVASCDITAEEIIFASNALATNIALSVAADGTSCEAIVVPQTLSGATLEFSVAGDTNVYSAPIKDAAYATGSQYSYTATIDKSGVALGTATISAWDAGNSASGEGLTVEKVPDIIYNDNDQLFEIYNGEGLKAFADLVNGTLNDTAIVDWGGCGFSFSETWRESINGKLMDNIDLKDICGKDIGVDGTGVSWTPIGNLNGEYQGRTFKGTFDGCNYSVIGLYINSESQNQALFGHIYQGETIKNLRVCGSVTTTGIRAAMVVGYVAEATIINCISEGDVAASSSVGGIVGATGAEGYIIACINSCEVTATYVSWANAGGVVGFLDYESNIVACYSSGCVKVAEPNALYIGGVVGAVEYATVTDNYWIGGVEGSTAVYGIGTYGNETDTNATKLDDIAALNGVVGVLNDAIATWNTNNTDNACQYQAGADDTTPPTFILIE